MSKGSRLTDVEYLESQLHEVENRLQEAVGLLDGLKAIQEKFKHLATLTQQLQAHGEEAQGRLQDGQSRFKSLADDVNNTLSYLQRSFEELKAQNEAQWMEFRGTLVKAQEDLHTAQRNLRTELGLQVNELRGDVEQRLEQFSQRQQKALEEVNHKTKEVVDEVHRLLEEQNRELKNQQKLLAQLASNQDKLEGKVRLASNIAIAAVAMAAVAIILTFVLGR